MSSTPHTQTVLLPLSLHPLSATGTLARVIQGKFLLLFLLPWVRAAPGPNRQPAKVPATRVMVT